MQELRKIWKLHTKQLKENRRVEPAENKKITKATDLKIGQLVFVKDHQKGTFSLYVFDYRVVGILNGGTVVLTTPDRKEMSCNIHHVKPMTPSEVHLPCSKTKSGRYLAINHQQVIDTTYIQKQTNHKPLLLSCRSRQNFRYMY